MDTTTNNKAAYIAEEIERMEERVAELRARMANACHTMQMEASRLQQSIGAGQAVSTASYIQCKLEQFNFACIEAASLQEQVKFLRYAQKRINND